MTKQKTDGQAVIDGVVTEATEPVNVLVRVLYTCELGRANDVVSVCSQSELDILQRAGYVDADPAAVAYAQSLVAPKP